MAADEEGNVYVLDDQTNDVRGGTVTVLNPSGQANGYSLAGDLFTSRALPFGALSTTRIDELTYAVYTSGASLTPRLDTISNTRLRASAAQFGYR